MNEEQNPRRGLNKIRELLSREDSPLRKLEPFRGLLLHALLWVLVMVYLESLLHGVVFRSLTARYFYILGFSLPVALALSLLLGLLPKRVNMGVSIGLVTALCIVFGSQLVYYFVFGSLYSLSRVAQGGDAVTSFWKETLLTMSQHVGPLLLCLLPILGICLACRFLPRAFERLDLHNKAGWYARGALAALAVAAQIVTILALPAGGTGFYTPYSFYYGNDATMTQTTDAFGLMTALRLEVSHTGGADQEAGYYYAEVPPVTPTPRPDAPENGLPRESPPPEYDWNVLEIDFDALNGMTQDKTLLALNEYVSSISGTQQNEYTGMLAGYNLIAICAESLSAAALDPELTPTLYRMAHEGFVFNNYYNTFPDNTSDGEYAFCMGLLPDGTRGKTASSFYASRNSYLPMALGNIFKEQRGIQGLFFHNYRRGFYGRYLTHPNMGYKCKFAGSGMSFTTSWPASDLEMMEQSIPDYLEQDQFLAYYMTFSGHMQYNRSVNPMSRRNYDQVKDLPISEAAKCYLSGNIELDKAMAYLLEQLEEAGIADRTAIVMAGDHFPYGLTYSQYDELIGHETDFFEKYHDTLIFWVGGMEPVEVDTYCCNIDILPTILNLWGFEYDSRLLAGTDVFSNGTHAAILVDQSFLTDKVWFNTNTNTATWLVDEKELPESYLDSMIRMVKNKFSISTDILNTAYYNFIFDAGTVKVTKAGWITEEEWNGTAKKDDDPVETPQVEDPLETQLPWETELPMETGAPAEPQLPEEAQGVTPPEAGLEPPPEEQTPDEPSETPPQEQTPEGEPEQETPPEAQESEAPPVIMPPEGEEPGAEAVPDADIPTE